MYAMYLALQTIYILAMIYLSLQILPNNVPLVKVFNNNSKAPTILQVYGFTEL